MRRLLPHLGKAFKAEERHNAGKAGETGAFREPSDGSLPLQDIACEVFEGYLQVFQSFSQENISSSDAQNGFNTDKGERVTDTALETASSDQATEPEDTLPNQEFYYEDFFLLPSSLNSDDVLIRSILSGKKHTEMLSSTRSEHGSTNNRLSTVLSTLSITEETETKEMLSVLYRLVQKTDYIGLVRSCTLIKQITGE